MSLSDLRDKVEVALESLIVRWTLGVAFGVLVALGGWTLKTVFEASIQLGQVQLQQLEVDRRLADISLEFGRGRAERMANDSTLGARVDSLSESVNKRIDDVNLRISELQRQTAAIEGKLGEFIPAPRH